MSTELTAFFITIMNDLDDREKMYTKFMDRRPKQNEQTEKLIAQVHNIKHLTTMRARQFGLTVADSQECLELHHQMGISSSDYKALPRLGPEDCQ
jgi:2-phosphoglycerate kinase